MLKNFFSKDLLLGLRNMLIVLALSILVFENISFAYVPIADSIKKVFTKNSITCSISVDNTLYCWGYNYDGQVGNGNTDDQSTPVKVLEDVSSVGLGEYHTCAIKANGKLYC